MIDPALERTYADCAELLDLWRHFHEFVVAGVKGESATPEREVAFMNVKSRIAMLHDSFMKALTADQNIGQSMLTIVGRAITLHHLARMSVAELKKMEIEWHQSFLLLQETLGNLEDRREKLSEVSEAAYKADRARTMMKQRIDRVVKSNTFIGLIIFVALAFATVGVQVLGIWEWANLRHYNLTKTPFYYGYDIGLRSVFPTLPYYRLDWVEINPGGQDMREFLPGGYWVYNLEEEANPAPETGADIRGQLDSFLPASTMSEIRNSEDYKEIWCFNSQDFICMALLQMESSSQADRLAGEIRSSVLNTPAENRIGASNRANILIVLYFGERNNSTSSRDAFSEFKQRAPELIR